MSFKKILGVAAVVIVIVAVLALLVVIHRHRQYLADTQEITASQSSLATTGTTTSTSTGTAAVIKATAASSASLQNAGKRYARSVTVDGLKRNYTLFMPRAQTKDGSPHPILFAYHPAEAAVTFMEENAPFHLANGTESFVVIYPEGYGRTFNAGGCCGAAYSKGVDDVAFFKAIMADVAKLIPIRSKAYVTGFSNGSFMTYRLVCDVPQMIEAAVPFAGAIDMTNCVSGYKVPIMHINGASDVFTLTGVGSSATPKFQHAVNTVVVPYTALDPIATRNGCTETHQPTTGLPSMDASCEAYTGCPATAPVLMCLIPNLGHAWPGSGQSVVDGTAKNQAMAEKMGPYRPELDKTGAIVQFFLKY